MSDTPAADTETSDRLTPESQIRPAEQPDGDIAGDIVRAQLDTAAEMSLWVNIDPTSSLLPHVRIERLAVEAGAYSIRLARPSLARKAGCLLAAESSGPSTLTLWVLSALGIEAAGTVGDVFFTLMNMSAALPGAFTMVGLLGLMAATGFGGAGATAALRHRLRATALSLESIPASSPLGQAIAAYQRADTATRSLMAGPACDQAGEVLAELRRALWGMALTAQVQQAQTALSASLTEAGFGSAANQVRRACEDGAETAAAGLTARFDAVAAGLSAIAAAQQNYRAEGNVLRSRELSQLMATQIKKAELNAATSALLGEVQAGVGALLEFPTVR